jgi:hypothetical protein
VSIDLINRNRNVGADIDRSNRVRLISSLNPYMAENPQALLAMAELPMELEDLAVNAVGTYGMMMGDNLALQMESMSSGAQRALWEQLPPARQQALTQLGYRRPDDPEESAWGQLLGPVDDVVGGVIGGFNKAATAVGGVAWDGLNWVMDKPAQLYRTIRTMDDRNQWQAAAGAVLGVGLIAATRGRAANAGTLRTLGELGGAGLLFGAAGAAITNPMDFAEAFRAAEDGERTFKRDAVARARDLLGEPRIITLAKEVADADISVEDLAREMGSVTEGQMGDGGANAELAKLQAIVGRYATEGTPEHQQAFQMLYDVTQDPTFREAVAVLRNGKISPGRDLAGLIFDPGSTGYHLLSGAADAAFQVAVDPTLVGTEIFKLYKARRLGMVVDDGPQAIARFRKIQASEARVRRAHEIVAKAIDAENFEVIRQIVPGFSPIYLDALAYKRELQATEGLAEFGLEQFNRYMIDKTKLAPLMRGVGTVKAADGVILQGLGRGTERWKQITMGLRRMTDAMVDPRMEEALVEQGKRMLRVDADSAPLVADAMADDELLRAMFPASLYGEVDDIGQIIMPWHAPSQDVATRMGRFLGRSWAGQQVGELLTSLTTMIPKDRVIALVNDAEHGLSATDDIPKLMELGRYMGMPSYARRQWSNAILNAAGPNDRLRLMNGWLDNLLTMSGAKAHQEGREMMEKILQRNLQVYGAGDVDKLVLDGIERAAALLPGDQAMKVVMPDLHELRKAAMSGHLAKFLGIADAPLIEPMMNRIWKPAVLLRLAFIPRAAGEEFLALMLRGGMGSLVQELGARSVARRAVVEAAEVAPVERLTRVEAELVKQGWTGTLPAHMRPFGRNLERYKKWAQQVTIEDGPVVRMLARYDWTVPTQRIMEDYAGWLNRQLTEGTKLGRVALEPARRGIDAIGGALPEQVKMFGRQRNVRENITNTLNSLAFGNQYSWRRMLIGGVDDDLVKSLKPFYALHSRSIMGAVSAVNAGPLNVGADLTRSQTTPVLQDGEVRAEEFNVLRGHFTRLVADDPRFANAIHEQTNAVAHDPVVRRIIASELSRVTGSSVTVKPAVVADLLDWYGAATRTDLSLKLLAAEFASGAPSRDSLLVALHNLQEAQPTLIEGSTLAERLRNALPSGREATWDDLEPVLRDWGNKMHPVERREQYLDALDGLGRINVQMDNLAMEDRRFVGQLLRNSDTGWGVKGADIRASIGPEALPAGYVWDQVDVADARARIAEADRDLAVQSNLTVDDLRGYKQERMNGLDREVGDFTSELERLGATVDHATGRPRFAISPKPNSPEWEWWYQLTGAQRRHLARTYFSGGALPIDDLASTAGLSVDEWAQQFVRLAGKHTDAVSARSALRRQNLVDFRDEFLAQSPEMRQLTDRRDMVADELARAEARARGELVPVDDTPVPAPSPFYANFGEAEKAITARLKALVLDANEQDRSMASLRLSVLGESRQLPMVPGRPPRWSDATTDFIYEINAGGNPMDVRPIMHDLAPVRDRMNAAERKVYDELQQQIDQGDYERWGHLGGDITRSERDELFGNIDGGNVHSELFEAQYLEEAKNHLVMMAEKYLGGVDDVPGALVAGRPLQEGMVQLYVPTRMWKPDGSPVSIDDVLQHADNRRLIEANRTVVDSFLEALISDPARARTMLLADPQLAQELNKVAARLRGATPDPGALRVVDIEREVLDGRMHGITGPEITPTEAQQAAIESGELAEMDRVRGWLRPLAKDPADRAVNVTGWDVDSKLIEARMRPMDPTLDEKAQAWAEKITTLIRQRFTKGTREELIARRAKLADGTTAPLVYRRVGKDLVEVPEGEIVEYGEFLDRKGKRLQFGDSQYFESAGATVDDAGDMNWNLLGPIFEDVYDELSNFPRLLPKGEDAVRVYRSNIRHVMDAGTTVPNYAAAEMLVHRNESWFDRMVRFGFDRVIGPSLDALVRRPMATHYYAQRYTATRKWMDGFGDPGIANALDEIATRFKPISAMSAEQLRSAHDVLRQIALKDGHTGALRWTDAQAAAFARGFGREELTAMVDRVSRIDREGAEAARRFFELRKHVAGNVYLPADATVDDFLARMQAAIPDEMWTSRFDLQRHVREQLKNPDLKVVGRQARDVVDDTTGSYVMFTKSGAGWTTDGVVVNRAEARRLAGEADDPRGVRFKPVNPAEYTAPELDARLMDREIGTTIMGSDQRVQSVDELGRPVSASERRYVSSDDGLVDLAALDENVVPAGLVRAADIEYVLADDQFLDAARKRWDSLTAEGRKDERRRLGIPDDFGDAEVVDHMAARLRHRAAARGDEAARQALRDGIDPIMAAVLDDEVADVLVAWKRQQDWIEREAGERAAIAAIEDMVPFIDSHEFRTQFAEVGKGFLPFWYAEENFMKRWARTLRLEGPAVVAKATLGYMGLKHAGVIRTDEQGKDWFVYPGSGLLAEALAKLPFMPDTLPVSMMLASPTESMLPGMSSKFGTPSFSPLVSVPLTALTSMIPELEPTKRAILGDYGAGRNALEQMVPAWLVNTFDAMRTNEGNARYASAQLSAIAQLEANGQGLPDNATPGQQQEFLDRVQNHARVILFAQALSGFITPGPASQFYVDQESLFGMSGENVAAQLSTEYQTLIRSLGIEEGTKAYLARHPDTDIVNAMAYTVGKTETSSGAPVMPTEEAIAFYAQHEGYMQEFPDAGPWLLPQGGSNTRSMYAYDQQLGNELRRRRSPEEFLAAVKFKQASGQYFDVREAYLTRLDELKIAGDSAGATALTDRWETWSSMYKATHPIFRDQLDNSDGRIQRRRTLEQMRVIVNDPGAPQAEHFGALKELIGYWDAYTIRKAALAEDGSARGRDRMERFKTQFSAALEGYVAEHPEVRSFWLSVLRPEAGFD